ncbi:nucleoside phosphorylase [Pseudosporangium ferrugineum]|uniref:Nucleoside phosphorylase n=1 Tax=Pseudosporangium ferrugineum TaxID=439699 RepID=A0A2T0RFN8_9ACTN|nr:nucleoside phosphorylase [Pseudosporangium ferrugineum]
MFVAVIETGPGNVPAAVLSARAEEFFRPYAIVMMGIAGGLKDVEIGDVVAGSKVYWIEAGKQDGLLFPRPDQAAVSQALVQLARAVAADGSWLSRGVGSAGSWSAARRSPVALVAPVVVGEKVIADRRSEALSLIRKTYGDAVAVDMEDFGALSGGQSNERARVIAVRGISDLIDDKSVVDAEGSQPLAAANAAAFVFEMLARLTAIEGHPPVGSSSRMTVPRKDLAAMGAELYPDGPQQESVWERAGGDPSRLLPSGTGAARWWHAANLLQKGGGGLDISAESLVQVMMNDYPTNQDLRRMISGI